MAGEGDEREKLRLLAKDYRSAAWAAWLAPLFAVPLLFLPVLDPGFLLEAITEAWELYLLFVVLPWVLGTAFSLHSRRLERERPLTAGLGGKRTLGDRAARMAG